MRSKKSRRVKKPTRVRRVTRARESLRVKPARVEKSVNVGKSVGLHPGQGVMLLVICIICVMTAALLMASRQSSVERGDVATLDVRDGRSGSLDSLVHGAQIASESSRADATERAQATEASKPAARTLAAATPSTDSQVLKATPAVKTTALADAVPAVKTMHAVEPIERPHAAELLAARADETSPMVTVTGCLESDDQVFKLKDTTGLDAPTSRSWKTGFLKKRSASIEVGETANGISLTNHIGQRVALTGTLVDREMNVRSVRRIADSCKQ
jgi:hypothetical protein